MRRHSRQFIASTVTALVVLILFAPVSSASAEAATQCADVSVPVSAAGDSHARISGTLCLPTGKSPDTIQILIPGATYNRIYWDFPGRSYARYAAAHGQAAFAIDRLDTGQSSQVNPEMLTVQADASAVHQVVSALRTGVAGHRFSTVILGGHSLGSIVAVTEDALYHDANGLVLSGFTHLPQPAFIAAIPTILRPAQLDGDPTLANRPLGEMTIDGADRAKYFHAVGDSDPAVIAEDAATRDTLTTGELLTFPTDVLELDTVTAPVLIAVGSKDAGFGCGLLATSFCTDSAVLRASEQPFFPNTASFTADVIPNAGHDLNLANNYAQWFAVMSTWCAHVG